MGKYKIEKFIIEQSGLAEKCDITIVGRPNINVEDMKMVKDYIEGLMDFDHHIKINVSTPSLTDSYNKYLMVARGNGKTQYTLELAKAYIGYYYQFQPKKIIFNGPATIVLWGDETKTVVKCQDGDTFDPEKGIALCFMKKALGNRSNFNNVIKKYLNEVNNN